MLFLMSFYDLLYEEFEKSISYEMKDVEMLRCAMQQDEVFAKLLKFSTFETTNLNFRKISTSFFQISFPFYFFFRKIEIAQNFAWA